MKRHAIYRPDGGVDYYVNSDLSCKEFGCKTTSQGHGKNCCTILTVSDIEQWVREKKEEIETHRIYPPWYGYYIQTGEVKILDEILDIIEKNKEG